MIKNIIIKLMMKKLNKKIDSLEKRIACKIVYLNSIKKDLRGINLEEMNRQISKLVYINLELDTIDNEIQGLVDLNIKNSYTKYKILWFKINGLDMEFDVRNYIIEHDFKLGE